MAQFDPGKADYLAIVSEWSSQTPRGGLVGNAYPIFNLTEERVVSEPESEFPNPGAVFLTNRGGLTTWDFVRLRPRQNNTYKNANERDCFFIQDRYPEIVDRPDDLPSVAVVLNHPTFDPSTPTRQIQNPESNVTPLFFVRRADVIFGPLLRDGFHLSSSDDVQRIDWRPAKEDGVVYEFSERLLDAHGVRLHRYSHPLPERNRILGRPIVLAVGKLQSLRSEKLHDSLPLTAVVDWYLKRCPRVSIPLETVEAMKESFQAESTDPPAIVAARQRRIFAAMSTHAAFIQERDRFAREYLESPEGARQLRELMEQEVLRRASDIQTEVDRRESTLAARRNELAAQLEAMEAEHRRQVESLAQEESAARVGIDSLRAIAQELKQALHHDADQLAAKMREQIPLIVALSNRFGEATIPSRSETQPRLTRAPFRAVAPSASLRSVVNEANLVDDLRADLARQGLNFARDFVANVYTCMKAESLNLVIGPPGYGKSMLVTSLARSLGHADAFLPITVRRSWAEDRHLIGFFDAFNGRYDPGPTGLVPRLLQAQADWESERSGIYIVLLDEFNLAAPEYYFAQLLQTLPSDDPGRDLVLYDPAGNPGDGFPHRVKIGPNMRFWGTINYDETTERLSPRTLDRTGMIFLGESDVRPSASEEFAPMRGVAARDLMGALRRTPGECSADRWALAANVIDELRSSDAGLGPKIEISPRVQKAIRRYLANSELVLDARTAVDFVVQQRILPVVRGRGDSFLARVRRLKDLLARLSLDRSARHVEETLRRSESQFGDVDFLSY